MANARQKQHATRVNPVQTWETNTRTSPLTHSRTNRQDNVSVVTSGFGGKLVPLKFIPLLREDAARGMLNINVQMAETASMLLNPVRVSAAAYLVPKLALNRFQDMGTIDRSYAGEPEVNGSVVPWFQPAAGALLTSQIAVAAGLHFQPGKEYNDDYFQAYNAVWNFIAANRSPSLTLRAANDGSLGPAFWPNTQMKHVVPTFDAAMMEGEVPVTITEQQILTVPGQAIQLPINRNMPDGVNTTGISATSDSSGVNMHIDGDTSQGMFFTGANGAALQASMDGIYSEIAADGVVVSLANIDMARQTAAWARMRTQFQGISEEWMIDQLVQGIRLNDRNLKQPILLDASDVTVGMAQRYATDAANLTESVTDGRTALQLRVSTPAVQCGGVIVVVAQALPEQIYERQRDYYMAALDVAELPNRTRDELDPQPVAMLKNAEVDEAHTDPESLFGYAPLNHQWQRNAPNVGGRYYRPDPTAPWDEDRNRIWDTGVIDPELGPDFYTSESLQHNVFQSATEEPFEFWMAGQVVINGLTYFGPSMRESDDDYDTIRAQVPTDRLKGDGTDIPV